MGMGPSPGQSLQPPLSWPFTPLCPSFHTLQGDVRSHVPGQPCSPNIYISRYCLHASWFSRGVSFPGSSRQGSDALPLLPDKLTGKGRALEGITGAPARPQSSGYASRDWTRGAKGVLLLGTAKCVCVWGGSWPFLKSRSWGRWVQGAAWENWPDALLHDCCATLGTRHCGFRCWIPRHLFAPCRMAPGITSMGYRNCLAGRSPSASVPNHPLLEAGYDFPPGQVGGKRNPAGTYFSA